jgi:hypothetical protein
VKIAGPGQTPYEGGLFNAELFLPDEYPMVPPKVLFRTKIYHPNIDKLGKLHSFSFMIKTNFLISKSLCNFRKNLFGHLEGQVEPCPLD